MHAELVAVLAEDDMDLPRFATEPASELSLLKVFICAMQQCPHLCSLSEAHKGSSVHTWSVPWQRAALHENGTGERAALMAAAELALSWMVSGEGALPASEEAVLLTAPLPPPLRLPLAPADCFRGFGCSSCVALPTLSAAWLPETPRTC